MKGLPALPRPLLVFVSLLLAAAAPSRAADPKKIVFLPGSGSHGYGAHAHPASCRLLARLLTENVPGVEAVVHDGGWPSDPKVLDGAAAIVIACDGNGVIGNHYPEADALARKGVGFAFLHYALDVGNTERGARLLDWIGGFYEQHWSVNPHWKAEFKSLPSHPVTRGVRPFSISDEWYYHMRFREDMKGVTPILSAVPPDKTRDGPDGPHSGNPTVRSRRGLPEHVAWASERPAGGRGFGFTGGHSHWNWAQDDFRKVVLNAIAWVAGLDVPENGVPSPTPTPEELMANQHAAPPADWSREKLAKIIENIRRPD